MKNITECRACGSKALTPVFSRLHQSKARWFRRNTNENGGYVLCDPSRDARACGLVQSAEVISSPVVTPSGRHRSNRERLRAVATEALELLSGRDCSALDIGCNDGTLLSYYPRWVERFGVDSCSAVEEIGPWASTVRADFQSDEIEEAFGDRKFDIITAVSLFEHINDPRQLLTKAKSLLSDDGVFVLETLYAPVILTRNSVESFQLGVSALYSLSVLEWLLRDHGLKVFKGAVTEKEGGSLRLFVCHDDCDEFDFDPWYERLAQLWDEENALAMRALQPYQSFERRAEQIREDFVEKLEEMSKRGESAHILGADEGIEALIKWAGPAAKAITAAVDTVAAREDRTLNDGALPVIAETESRSAEPDYLIASSRYKLEALEKWRESILLGARMIFMTPDVHEVNASNFSSEFAKVLAGGDQQGDVTSLRSILSVAGGPRLVAESPQKTIAK